MIKEIDKFKNYGMAFYGINSSPVMVSENIYQIKCMVTQPCNYFKYEMKYLQFNLCDGFSLELLNNLKSNYIKSCHYAYCATNNSNVHIVKSISELKEEKPHSYDANRIHSLYIRLCKLKKQTKPILKGN